MQAKELSVQRHISPAELSALNALLSPAGQASIRNAQRQAETFRKHLVSAGVPDSAERGDADPGFHGLSIASPQRTSVVPGMVPAEDGVAFAERMGGTTAAEAAFVIIPRKFLRELLDSLNDLDLRADRAERGTLRTIRMAMEARLTTLPRTVAEIRTLVAAIVQDVRDASDAVQDEARDLDRIGFAVVMAIEGLHDVERAAVNSLDQPARRDGIIV